MDQDSINPGPNNLTWADPSGIASWTVPPGYSARTAPGNPTNPWYAAVGVTLPSGVFATYNGPRINPQTGQSWDPSQYAAAPEEAPAEQTEVVVAQPADTHQVFTVSVDGEMRRTSDLTDVHNVLAAGGTIVSVATPTTAALENAAISSQGGKSMSTYFRANGSPVTAADIPGARDDNWAYYVSKLAKDEAVVIAFYDDTWHPDPPALSIYGQDTTADVVARMNPQGVVTAGAGVSSTVLLAGAGIAAYFLWPRIRKLIGMKA